MPNFFYMELGRGQWQAPSVPHLWTPLRYYRQYVRVEGTAQLFFTWRLAGGGESKVKCPVLNMFDECQSGYIILH